VYGEGDRLGRDKELGMLDLRGDLPDAGSPISPLLLECLPRGRVDTAIPPALVLTLEDRGDLSDAPPCLLTLGRKRLDA
jgi:hypothetical protein